MEKAASHFNAIVVAVVVVVAMAAANNHGASSSSSSSSFFFVGKNHPIHSSTMKIQQQQRQLSLLSFRVVLLLWSENERGSVVPLSGQLLHSTLLYSIL